MNKIIAAVIMVLTIVALSVGLYHQVKKNGSLQEQQKQMETTISNLKLDIEAREKIQVDTQKRLNDLQKQKQKVLTRVLHLPVTEEEQCLSPVLLEAVKEASK